MTMTASPPPNQRSRAGSAAAVVCLRGRGAAEGAAWAALILILACCLAAVLAGPALARVVQVQDAGGGRAVAPRQHAEADAAAASRDSLLKEISRYSRIIAAMRDSLDLGSADIQMTEERRLRIEKSIEDVTRMVEDVGRELSRLDLKIVDNRISLLNDAGEGIVINIPENLDKNISEGLNAITKIILAELPDSLGGRHARTWNWSGFATPPAPPPVPRKVIAGNVVKVGDDLFVPEHEDVSGNVVVVMGDAEIAGRVDGDVVVVMGNLEVGPTAEIQGKVVTIGGRLDQDEAVDLNQVYVIDPLHGPRPGLAGVFGRGPLPFFALQGLFLLTLALACLAAALTPTRRFDAITGHLLRSPAVDLGVGAAISVVGNSVALVLMAILVLTVIGLPLALLVGLAVGLVSILAVAVTAAVVGRKACAAAGRTCPSPVISVLVGVLLLHVVSFVGGLAGAAPSLQAVALPLSLLGLTIKVLAYLLGLGALAKSRLGSA